MVNSRAKGGSGERELSREIDHAGISRDCERTAQRCGKGGTADVRGIEGVHIECKRVEALNIWKAMEQAKRDAANGDIPSVWFRRNRDEWYVVVPLRLLVEFCRRIIRSVEKYRKDEAA